MQMREMSEGELEGELGVVEEDMEEDAGRY